MVGGFAEGRRADEGDESLQAVSVGVRIRVVDRVMYDVLVFKQAVNNRFACFPRRAEDSDSEWCHRSAVVVWGYFETSSGVRYAVLLFELLDDEKRLVDVRSHPFLYHHPSSALAQISLNLTNRRFQHLTASVSVSLPTISTTSLINNHCQCHLPPGNPQPLRQTFLHAEKPRS